MRRTLFALALAIPALAKDIPIADPAAAAQTINAGDTLILNDGTWADAHLKIHAEGTAE